MPIVKASDLAAWAASLDPEAKIVLGNDWLYDDEDFDLHVRPVEWFVRQVYLYELESDGVPEGIGYVKDDPTDLVPEDAWPEGTFAAVPDGEESSGMVVWHGVPCWRLGE